MKGFIALRTSANRLLVRYSGDIRDVSDLIVAPSTDTLLPMNTGLFRKKPSSTSRADDFRHAYWHHRTVDAISRYAKLGSMFENEMKRAMLMGTMMNEMGAWPSTTLSKPWYVSGRELIVDEVSFGEIEEVLETESYCVYRTSSRKCFMLIMERCLF